MVVAAGVPWRDLLEAFKAYLQWNGFVDVVLRNLPRNPLVDVAIATRAHQTSCQAPGVTNEQCYQFFILPVLEGDEAAVLGSKLELMAVIAVFLAYPVCCNWLRNATPLRQQMVIASISAVALTAAWAARAYLVYRHTPAAYQRCVDMASAIALSVLALWMWHASPPPANLFKVILEQQREVEKWNEAHARSLNENIGAMTSALAGVAEKVVDLHRTLPDLAAAAASATATQAVARTGKNAR